MLPTCLRSSCARAAQMDFPLCRRCLHKLPADYQVELVNEWQHSLNKPDRAWLPFDQQLAACMVYLDRMEAVR